MPEPRPAQLPTRSAVFRTLSVRTGILFLVWVVLSGADAEGYVYGAAIAVGTAALSLRWLPPGRRSGSWLRLLALVPSIAALTVRGGVDVARRALSPRMPLDPDFVFVELRSRRLRYPTALLVSIMPGSLAVSFMDNGLLLHVVDRKQSVQAAVTALEDKLRRALLGVEDR